MNEFSVWEQFECQRCGGCCMQLGLPYDSYRAHDIARYLGISVEEVISRYYGVLEGDGKHWISDEAKRTPCPFLVTVADRKACRIFPVRPEACRGYPFGLDAERGETQVDCPIALRRLAEETLRNA